MINQTDIKKLMQATGMGEMQAYRHLRDRERLFRFTLSRRVPSGNGKGF